MANIVEAIKNELTGDLLNKVAASVGGSVDSVKSAANAATPSLLSVLAGLASGRQGADALVAALRGFENESPEKLRIEILEGRGDDLQRRGGGVLDSLLGGTLPSLTRILAQFENINPELVKKVLGYLVPLILSTIAARLKTRGELSAAGLTSFFTEQKSNIGGAIPPGLSLVGLPSPPHHHHPSAAVGQSNPWYWLAPLLVLAAIGLLIWFAFLRTPVPPRVDVDRTTTTPVPRHEQPIAPSDAKTKQKAAAVSNNEGTPPAAERTKEAPPTADEVIRSLGKAHVIAIQSLASVNSAETAEEQLSMLTGLGPELDVIKGQWDQLSDTDKKAVAKSTAENRDAFKSLVEKALTSPEIAEKLKNLLEELVAKMDQFQA